MKQKKVKVGWKFDGDNGEFILASPHRTSGLYFPLANESGMMSSITPLLSGDIKTSQNTFLTIPMSINDLSNSKSSRNFWIRVNGEVWSATGNSPSQMLETFSENTKESVKMRAGFLWQKVTRKNKALGLKSQITNFVPVNDDKIELMNVTITNITSEDILITPIAAIPIYGRSADNVRDHSHVTSLLHRISTNEYGVVVKPALSFDERGHKINKVIYSVQGVEENGDAPLGFYPVKEDFEGEGGNLEWPETVVKNIGNYCGVNCEFEGYEAMGAMRFNDIVLRPDESSSYIIIMGISEDLSSEEQFIERYGDLTKFNIELDKNKKYWENRLSTLSFKSGNKDFDSWMKWVELQPMLRRIFGCSFLPHHDYGRGGRGWRDLWQDCLALLVMDPKQVRELLFNNFAGVRMDGSNATIIGSEPGEFIADRNNISRIWMDHGAWPYTTTRLYVDQSGDLDFLLRDQSYFKDKQCRRSKGVDNEWNDDYGKSQKDVKGNLYKGSILEHILLEQLTSFYNVGERNNIKLEGADWNDAFDLAEDKGESVAFTALYGSNLMDLSKLLISLKEKLKINEIEISSEMIILLDSLNFEVNYDSVNDKNDLLQKYFDLCIHNVSGEKAKVDIDMLSKDLERKAVWITEHIRKNEWIKNSEGFEWFNGYYDNDGEKLEGDFHQKDNQMTNVRMTLTGQVFEVMGGIANEEQVKKIICSAEKYLMDEKIGGLRLNTDFHELKLNMGRCFGFAYGHKENGSMFSHMAVMYINALYKRNFVKEAYKLLDMIYTHCSDFEKSRIFPGIPEYINERGRGMYSYLTGAASWLLYTMLSEVYGVKGYLGDLIIEPKLVKAQFDLKNTAAVATIFRDKRLNITYKNEKFLQYGEYSITKIILDSKVLTTKKFRNAEIIDKDVIDLLSIGDEHKLYIELE